MDAHGQCGTITGSPWIATGYALAMTRCEENEVCGSVTTRSLSLREESEVRDAAIHRVLGETIQLVCSCTVTQWITTGYALAMTTGSLFCK